MSRMGALRWRSRRKNGAPTFVLLLVALVTFQRSRAQYIPRDEWGRESSKREIQARDTQSSTSTNLWLTSHDDFCIYGPPDPFQYIWDAGTKVVSWCSKAGHGTRLIPDGTLHGVTYVETDNYVQVSGNGDFTKINIAPGDSGGQYDLSSHTPSGASLTVSEGKTAGSWVTLISAETFCVRACTGDAKYCPTNFDQMGCWFLTGNSIGWDGVYQDCQSEDGDPPGVISGSTYTQGNSPTPTPTAASLSACQAGNSVSNGQSPPPLFSWGGSGTAVPISGGGNKPSSGNGDTSGPSKATSGSASGATGAGGASTSWVAVNTCIPCSGSATASASGTSSGASAAAGTTATKTTQAGVTQVSGTGGALLDIGTHSSSSLSAAANSATKSSTTSPTGDVALDLGSTTTSSSALKSTTTSTSLNDFIGRDVVTTTSNGQCCFTTWTPSVVSTSTSSYGASKSTTSGLLTTASAGSKSNSSSVSGPALTGTVNASAGVSGKGGNGTGGTNGNGSSNGTNHSSHAVGLRRTGGGGNMIWGLLGSGLGSAIVGLVVGGWSLL